MKTVIKIENLSKQYRLGVIGHGTLSKDFQSWWAKRRGKEDPNSPLNPALNDSENQREGDRFWALRNIDLDIEEGEVVGLIGKNGAGKSTLLKILSRVTKPTTGTVKIKGRLASLLEVGTGFHPELTGKENIYLNGAILGMTKQEIEGKLFDIIRFSGVDQYMETPVKRYSSGMRVRLAFAVAAHLEADILLVDEVLAVGDFEFQKKALGKMKEITRTQKRAVLFVSHNMAAVGNLCTRVCVLNNGGLAFNGDTEQGIHYYINKAIASDDSASTQTYPEDQDKPFQFTRSWIENGDGERIDTIRSGQKIAMVITYRSSLQVEQSVYITVNIISEDNVVLVTMSNRFVSRENLKLNESGTFRFIVDRVPLPAGKYGYRLKAGGLGVGNLDVVENAGSMDVVRGDFFGTGKMTKGYNRGVLIDHQFLSE